MLFLVKTEFHHINVTSNLCHHSVDAARGVRHSFNHGGASCDRILFFFLKTNDDGIFVKVNDQRVKNRLGNLMEEIIEVKEATARNN